MKPVREGEGSVLSVDKGAGRRAHPDEEVGEAGVKPHDVFGKSTESLFEGLPGFGIVLADLRGCDRGGGEQGESFGVVGGLGEIHGG